MIEWKDTFDEQVAAMSDAELRKAYLACDGECDDPTQAALAKACEERGIDI